MKSEIKVSDYDWALACSAIRGEIFDNISPHNQSRMFRETWALQDGFGPDVPITQWDWSAIRDSSSEAKSAIVAKVKSLLVEWHVSTDEMKLNQSVEHSRKLRAELEAEFPGLIDD